MCAILIPALVHHHKVIGEREHQYCASNIGRCG